MDWAVEVLVSRRLTHAEAKDFSTLAVVSNVGTEYTRLRAYVFAETVRHATNSGLDRFNFLLSKLRPNAIIVGFEVIVESVRAKLPRLPEIVGSAEVQEILFIKHRQQVSQMAALPKFPKPFAVLASGRIWLKSDIEAYKAVMQR